MSPSEDKSKDTCSFSEVRELASLRSGSLGASGAAAAAAKGAAARDMSDSSDESDSSEVGAAVGRAIAKQRGAVDAGKAVAKRPCMKRARDSRNFFPSIYILI